MKRVPSIGSIEPLESRIAPAVIRIGGIPDDPTNTHYHQTAPRPVVDGIDYNVLSFVDTSTSADPISQAVGHDALDSTYYLALRAGDTIEEFTSGGSYQQFLHVTSGEVIVFFTDINHDNNFNDLANDHELTGLSLSANAVVEVDAGVNGDIVTNLDAHGKPNDLSSATISMTGLVSPKQGIGNLKVLGGSITGNILSGGTINSLNIEDNVNAVLAGTAAVGMQFHFFQTLPGDAPAAGGVVNDASLLAPPGQVGASINNATIGSITDRMEAGGGGFGAKGGTLNQIQITNDTDGFQLLAGAGGAGDAPSHHPNGGAGGDATNIFVAGAVDNTPDNHIIINSGAGGDGLVTAKGGIGGKVSNVQVGFEVSGSRVTASNSLVADTVHIGSGIGGDGKTGGAGGLISSVKVQILTPDASGNEIEVIAGNGGTSTSPGGKAGAGGSINGASLLNQLSTPVGDILVAAGSGGSTPPGGFGSTSTGAAGGSVQNVELLGFNVQVTAGDGSDGKVGGVGGGVSQITLDQNDHVSPRNFLVDAGHGGIGFGGNGGAGGAIKGILVGGADFESFVINAGISGDGGQSVSVLNPKGKAVGGFGGAGGGVANVNVVDIDSQVGQVTKIEGNVDLTTGAGADGFKGGGAGGSFNTVLMSGFNVNYSAIAGDGGSATSAGKGGVGGGVTNMQLQSSGQINGVDSSGLVESGKGGTGHGNNGAGGAGGDVTTTSLLIDGGGAVRAGDGGDGQATTGTTKGGAPGSGGNIFTTGIFGVTGSGELRAGNAGSIGAKPAAGGNIVNKGTNTIAGVRAGTDITVIAGHGSNGGQGGDITGLTYGSTSVTLTPTPSGTILIEAGNGSAGGTIGGRGGNISNTDGSVSSGAGKTTTFLAGTGGGSGTVTKPGAGGSISNITISRGGAAGGVLLFQAGDAGNAPQATTGAAGGNVQNVGVTDIDPGTIFRDVGAGDGGVGKLKGGLGGSVTGVFVQDHDIGVRSGEAFGYDTQGGVFAGVGGKTANPGVKGAANGINGSVSGISAKAISSIVAGRTGVPHLAQTVSNISLSGGADTLLLDTNNSFVPNGDFRLSFTGANGIVYTTPLIKSQSPASVVAAALNGLDGIAQAGGVTVTTTPSRGYAIQFNVPGQQNQISGIEFDDGLVNEVTAGGTQNTTGSTVTAGVTPLTVTETGPGQTDLSVIETVAGAAAFTASQQQPGNTAQIAIEVLDLRFLASFPTATFTLSFDGINTSPLPANASASDIETALNGLPSIAAAGGVTVALAPNETERFVVNFTQFGAQPSIMGTRLVPETERVNVGSVATTNGATFSLTFDGASTVSLPFHAAPQDVAAALNALATIKAVGPGNTGAVTVSSPFAGQYDITFNVNGEQDLVSGTGLLPEQEHLDLGTLASTSGATMILKVGPDSTPALSATASAAAIQVALNKLPTIQAAGGVTVLPSGSHGFDIVYVQDGEQVPLTANGFQQESQSIDLSGVGSSSDYDLSVQHNLNVTETTLGKTNPNILTTDPTFPGQFTITASTVTAGNTTTQAVERLNLNSVLSRNGTFEVNFAGQTTVVLPNPLIGPNPLGNNPLNLQIQTALNALVNVASVGGVTVALNGANTFDITFNTPGAENVITATAQQPEVEHLVITTLQADPTSKFTMSFSGEETAPLTAVGVTAAQVQTALNGLASVAAQGGVVVTSTGAGVFDIAFAQIGTPNAEQPQIIVKSGGKTSHEHQLVDLGSLAAYNSGYFQLSFGGQATAGLPVTASAADVQTALNALPSIQAIHADKTGDVIVTSPSPGKFDIEYDMFGPQPLVVATGAVTTDPYPVLVGETHHGSQVSVLTSESRPGAFTSADVVELNRGDFGAQEVQRINLSALDPAAPGDFILSFGSITTPSLPANASASVIEAALNSLASIKAVGGVTVQSAPDNSFDVTFNNQGDQVSLQAQYRLPEVQTIDLQNVAPLQGGEFSLSFGIYKTAPISASATPTDIADALNILPSVQNAGGVTVTQVSATQYAVEFGNVGDQPALIGVGGGDTNHETQRVTLDPSLPGLSGSQFHLTFNGETTAPISANASAADVQNALNALNSVQDLRADGAGSVTVSLVSTGVYDVSFNSFGDQPNINGHSLVSSSRAIGTVETQDGSSNILVPVTEATHGVAIKEVQTLHLANVEAGNKTFKLTFGGVSTGNLAANSTAAQISLALNALGTINTPSVGGVTVTGNPSGVNGGTGDFVITFNKPGLEGPITATSTASVSVTENAHGQATSEVEVFDLSQVLAQAGAGFQLSFDNNLADTKAADITPILAGNANAATIQTALNSIASIVAAGGVAVAVDGANPNAFDVTFTLPGAQSLFSGIGGIHEQQTLDLTSLAQKLPVVETTVGNGTTAEVQTLDLSTFTNNLQLRFGAGSPSTPVLSVDPNMPSSTQAAEIQNALNALPGIQTAGGVTVAPAAQQHMFTVTFNQKGAEGLISGVGDNANSLFRLSVNGDVSQAVKVGATASELQAVINAMPTVHNLQANGQGSVTVTEVQPGHFQIDFNDLGAQPVFGGTATVSVEPTVDVHELTQGADSQLAESELVHGQSNPVSINEITVGDAATAEVQHLDLTAIDNVPNGIYQLSFNGVTTPFLQHFSNALDIQNALNDLSSIQALGPGGTDGSVTVTADAGNPHGFTITFDENGAQSLVTGQQGLQEVEHLDTSVLTQSGGGSFALSFNGGAVSGALTKTSTASDVSSALNGLANINAIGGVTVTATSSGFDVTFNQLGSQSAISGTVSRFEQQIIDVHQLSTVDSSHFSLSFNGSNPVVLSGNAVALDVQNALNALPSVKALAAGNTGSVSVVELTDGQFRVDFNQAGAEPLISGHENLFGTTERLSNTSTLPEIQAALNSVSFVDLSVTNGATPHTILAQFLENGDQPQIKGKIFTHEQQTVEVYDVTKATVSVTGNFTLTFNGNTTASLPATATADQIRLALNVLPSVEALGGIRSVVVEPDTTFLITFNNDNSTSLLSATQTLSPLPITDSTDPTTGDEIQTITFVPKGAFDPAKFAAASLAGAIVNPRAIDGNVFHFIELNGVPGFQEGDMPIDGIVMAKFLDQSSINFTPEAELTSAGFFDNLNRA